MLAVCKASSYYVQKQLDLSTLCTQKNFKNCFITIILLLSLKVLTINSIWASLLNEENENLSAVKAQLPMNRAKVNWSSSLLRVSSSNGIGSARDHNFKGCLSERQREISGDREEKERICFQNQLDAYSPLKKKKRRQKPKGFYGVCISASLSL